MASGDDLEVKIGASVEGLKKGFKEGVKETKKFTEKVGTAVKGTENLGKSSTRASS